MNWISISPRSLLVAVCLALIPCGVHAGAAEENNRWVPGYNTPGFAGNYDQVVSEWNADGFVMALGIANCLDVPGPNGTFEETQIWIWTGASYEYTNAGCVAGSVNALEQRGTNIYVGGGFTSIDGQAIQYLARWDGQTWSAPWIGQLNGPVFALDHDGTQNLYVGGSFSFAGGLGVSNVAKLDGFVWEPLDDAGGQAEGTNGPVNHIEVGAGGIIVAGAFTTAGGEPDVGNVASWSAGIPFGSWTAFGDGIASASGLSSLSVGTGEAWVTGAFNEPLIPATNIALFDLGGGFWASPGNPTLMGSIYEVDITGGNRVIARGDFTDFGDPNTQRIAEWVPTLGTWAALPNIEDAYDPTLFNIGKRVLARQNDTFYFDQRDDVNEADLPVYHGGITRFDGLNWHGLGQGFGDFDLDGQSHHVAAIYEHNSEIFVGGRFPNAGDGLHEGLACWQGGDWVAAGETLTSIGSVAVNNIARWDGADWNPVGTGVDGLVLDLEVVGSDLYASGEFTQAGGQVARGIAKWDGSIWTALGYGLNYVNVLDNDIGTGFELFFDPSNGQLGANPEGEPGGKLYVGGRFSYTGDKLSNNIGIYQVGEVVDSIFEDGFETGNTSAWTAAVP